MLLTNLERRGTSLYRLLGGIDRAIVSAQADHRFPRDAEPFLSACRGGIRSTKEYITSVIASECPVTGSATRLQELEGEISTLANAWRDLHYFIKPVIDANALRIPFPLVDLLNQHIRDRTTVGRVSILVCITPQLNYFQHRHSEMRKITRQLQNLLPDCPPFPKVGFLSLPFSQSQTLFMNCLLYHEAGHFIFEECGIARTVRQNIAQKIADHFHGPPTKDVQEFLVSKMLPWFEEVFCDVFAAGLLGPAYTLAAASLIDSLIGLTPSAIHVFSETHPAFVVRLQEQMHTLEKQYWKVSSEWWEQIKKVASVDENKVKPPAPTPDISPDIWRELIKMFLDNLRLVHQLCDERLPPDCMRSAEFNDVKKDLLDSLAHGIVPSTIFRQDGPYFPLPVPVLNAAMLFWADGMERLYKVVENVDPKSIADRAELETALEMWSIKAVEDWILRQGLRKERKSCQ